MSLHSHTPRLQVVDPRALLVREVAWYRAKEDDQVRQRVTRRSWDVAARAIADWDPRLCAHSMPANKTLIHSLSGRVVFENSVDAGWRLNLSGADGQVMEGRDSRGSHRQIDFDALLRLLSITETALGGQPVVAERYAYGDASNDSAQRNQCGRLIRHDDPAGTWRCDDFGLAGGVLSENRRFLQNPQTPDWPLELPERNQLLESGAGHTTAAAFDATAVLVRQTDAAGNQQVHRYTLGGSLQQSTLQRAGVQSPRTLISNIRYDAFGQTIEETLGNGVIRQTEYEQTTGRLIRKTARKSDGATLQDLTYHYDPVGNIVSIEDNTQAVRHFSQRRIDPVNRYVYDSLYQLIEASGREVSSGASHGPALPLLQSLQPDPNNLSPYTQHYEYDAGGNLLQLRHLGAQPFTRTMLVATDSNRSLPQEETDADLDNGFDANGNLLRLISGQSLNWDLRNQLRQVTAVQREDSSDDDEFYVYDGAGQRCRKIRTARAASSTLTSEVRYLPGLEIRSEPDGEVLHVCTLGAGSSNVRVLHWAANKPEGISNDQLRYSLNDHLGSSALELDDQAARISEEGYYPYGGTAWWAARSAVEAKYKTVRYSGKERDASGLYYYGFRYYAPWLQRWLNPDPGGHPDGINSYRAMYNNPITYLDPNGLMPTKPDTTYSDLAARGLIYPMQARGMNAVRQFWNSKETENGLASDAIAYRDQIPIAIETLHAAGQRGFLLTAHAHVVAAARTNTAQPSGAVMYHGGEMLSAVLSSTLGERAATAVVGPMSDIFNSPTAPQAELDRNRKLISSSVKSAASAALIVRHPLVKLVGATGLAAAEAMEQTEAGAKALYRGLRRNDSLKILNRSDSSSSLPRSDSAISLPRIDSTPNLAAAFVQGSIRRFEGHTTAMTPASAGQHPINLDAVRQKFHELQSSAGPSTQRVAGAEMETETGQQGAYRARARFF